MKPLHENLVGNDNCTFNDAMYQSGGIQTIYHEYIDTHFATDDLFTQESRLSSEIKSRLISEAFKGHYTSNKHYREYCNKLGVSPEHVSAGEDFAKIPLLTTGIFKHYPDMALTDCESDSVIITKSSGTKGSVSRVPRDNATLMRFFSSVAIGQKEVLGIETFDRRIFNLSPSTTEEPELWIAYVMAGVGVIYTTSSYIKNGVLQQERLLEEVIKNKDHESGISIVGPPPLVLDFSRYYKKHNGGPLTGDVRIVTVGGWKKRQNESIPKPEFRAELVDNFGLTSDSLVTDTYNMVELNTVVFECGHHNFHCPPWVNVTARDPKTLSDVGDNETGILCFLDPSPKSYPGFVLTDDFGSVKRSYQCECGLTSDVLNIERRINKLEMRGCALKLETITRE